MWLFNQERHVSRKEQTARLKDAFYIYKGKLIKITNCCKLVEHQGKPNTHDEEEFVESDDIHISFIKKETFDIDEDDSGELHSDYSSYEEEDLDLADNEAN